MSRGMLIWESALAGLQVIVGASALLTDWLGPRWFGLAVVVVAAAQIATATYKRGLAMPLPDPARDVFSREVADGWGSADVSGYPDGKDR